MAHVIPPSELRALVHQINLRLSDDEDVRTRLPIDPPTKLFEEVEDGLLLSKLVAVVQPDAIRVQSLHRPPFKNQYEKVENHNMCIEASRKIGCVVTNIGALDLLRNQEQHTEHLVLGLLWQIVKFSLMSKLTIHLHPELIRLVEQGEALPQFLQLAPEDILLRWVNYHLMRAGSKRTMTNFGADVTDSEIYSVLLHTLDPVKCPSPDTIRQIPDLTRRATSMLAGAAAIDCLEYVTPPDVVAGNTKLNLAFIANLFNKHPGIQLPSEEELRLMQQSGAELRSTLSQAQSSVHQLQTNIDKLSAENSALMKKLSENELASNTISSSNSALTNQLMEALEMNKTLQDALSTAESQRKTDLEEMETKFAAINLTLQQEQEQRANDNIARDATAKQHDDAINALKSQLLNTRTQAAKSIETSSIEKGQLELLLEEKEKMIQEQQAAAAALIAEHGNKVNDLLSQLQSEKDASQIAAKTSSNLEKNLAAVMAANERGSGAYGELNSRHTALENTLKDKESECEQHIILLADAEAKIAAQQAALIAAEKEKDEMRNTIASQQQRISELERQIAELRAAMRDLEVKRGEWETRASKAEHANAMLDTQLTTQDSMIQHLSGQV